MIKSALFWLGLGALAGALHAWIAPLPRIERAEGNALREIEISADEAFMAYEENRAIFLDARSEEQRNTLSRIPGSMALGILDFSGSEVPPVLEPLPYEAFFIVLCEDPAGCDSADLVVMKMAGLGYTNAKVLQGGLVRWRKDGRPVEGP